MTRPARLEKALAKRRAYPFQQFGQANDVYTANGATGCTHSGLQFLAYLWLRKWYTHDQISRLVGYPNQSPIASNHRRGLRPTEVQRFCTKVGLPYKVTIGLSASAVLTASAKGPVGIGVSYSYWPEWQNYRYRGVTADGHPNGFASPHRHAGRTQLVGFAPPLDAHFGVLLGYDVGAGFAYAWEPNHGSTARPERPPYDFMDRGQFIAVYRSYTTVLHRDYYALVPTRSLPL
jgi:hypothetical protein